MGGMSRVLHLGCRERLGMNVVFRPLSSGRKGAQFELIAQTIFFFDVFPLRRKVDGGID